MVCTISAGFNVDPVAKARADESPESTPIERLLTESNTATIGVRSFTTERSRSIAQPTPLPTPVAVDPNATPLPGPPDPTPVPVSHAPLAQPAAPVATVAAAVAIAQGGIWPVPGAGVSQYFSAGHPAVDLYAPCGTPILASYGGSVSQSGWKDNGGGNVVTISTDAGFLMEYNHLSTIAAAFGSYVPAGSVVGYVGATGLATGCHVHIAINANGAYVDPLAYF